MCSGFLRLFCDLQRNFSWSADNLTGPSSFSQMVISKGCLYISVIFQLLINSILISLNQRDKNTHSNSSVSHRKFLSPPVDTIWDSRVAPGCALASESVEGLWSSRASAIVKVTVPTVLQGLCRAALHPAHTALKTLCRGSLFPFWLASILE